MEKNVFITKANKKHNNKYKYIISLEDISSNDMIFILCPIHGKFEQRVRYHLSGQGCKKCGIDKLIESKRITTEDYIVSVKKKHNNYYDYSLVKYVDGREKIKIICPIHGEFEQIAKTHLYGSKCPKCVNDNKKNIFLSNTDDFIKKSNINHNSYYNYDNVRYVDSLTKVKIICPIHGEFEQKPREHIQGKGCSKCSTFNTKSEKEIVDFIKTELKINNIIENDRKILNGKELDIYLPEHNLAIEFNGIYYHSNVFVNKNYHLNKTEECEKQGIQLLHIFEDEWIYKSDIVKSIIKNKLGLTENKVYGRKCEIKEINNNDLIRNFLDNNHIQGFVGSKYKIGLFYENKLVSLMTFGNKRYFTNNTSKEGEYELLRFCNKLNTSVIGGASKLFKYFLNKYNPNEIISFADRRYSNGNLYSNLGMEMGENSKPNFFYSKNQKRMSRVGFQKHKLSKKFDNYNSNIPTNIFLHQMGYIKIYDCGNKKYIYSS